MLLCSSAPVAVPVLGLSVPIMWLYLLGNTITQYPVNPSFFIPQTLPSVLQVESEESVVCVGGGVEGSERDGLETLAALYPALTPAVQIRVHPRRVHPDHRVHLADGHAGGDAPEVPQPHLLHPLLPQPLHRLALGGHRRGLPGHAALHGGVGQRAGGSAPTGRQGEEGGVN